MIAVIYLDVKYYLVDLKTYLHNLRKSALLQLFNIDKTVKEVIIKKNKLWHMC